MSLTKTTYDLIKKRYNLLGFGYIGRLKRIKNFPFILSQIIHTIILFYGSGPITIHFSYDKQLDANSFGDIRGSNSKINLDDIENLTLFCINHFSYFLLTDYKCYCCGQNKKGQYITCCHNIDIILINIYSYCRAFNVNLSFPSTLFLL